VVKYNYKGDAKMKYLSVSEAAKKISVSERSIRNYCQTGKILGAILEGNSWKIPEDFKKPERKKRNTAIPTKFIDRLKFERKEKIKNSIYHKLQIDFTYNSNHIEGSRLSHEQTQYIFKTNTIGVSDEVINVDDVIETSNHFACIDYIIDSYNYKLSESYIKKLHFLLKQGTSDSRKSWFRVGDYKLLENEVGGQETAKPEEVETKIKNLIKNYENKDNIGLEDIIEFHYNFEKIHPFQDGNGRVGRLIMFKECIKHDIIPFIIEEDLKLYYYRGLHNWNEEKGYLLDTCGLAQDRFKQILDYYKLKI
jgi:Fic family protein